MEQYKVSSSGGDRRARGALAWALVATALVTGSRSAPAGDGGNGMLRPVVGHQGLVVESVDRGGHGGALAAEAPKTLSVVPGSSVTDPAGDRLPDVVYFQPHPDVRRGITVQGRRLTVTLPSHVLAPRFSWYNQAGYSQGGTTTEVDYLPDAYFDVPNFGYWDGSGSETITDPAEAYLSADVDLVSASVTQPDFEHVALTFEFRGNVAGTGRPGASATFWFRGFVDPTGEQVGLIHAQNNYSSQGGWWTFGNWNAWSPWATADYEDLVEVEVRPVGADVLEFRARCAAPIPSQPTFEEGMPWFNFKLDADSSSATGSPQMGIGVDYNAVVRRTEDGRWEGMLRRSTGGPFQDHLPIPSAVEGSTLRLSVPRSVVTGDTIRWFVESSVIVGVGSELFSSSGVDYAPAAQDVLETSLSAGGQCGSPQPPIASAPGSAASGSTYTVSWSSTSADATYELQEATDPAFVAATTFAVTGASRTVLHSVPSDTTFHYRVRAVETCGGQGYVSHWSSTVSTTVSGSCDPPAAPALTVPANTASGVPYTVSWTATSPDSSYELQESTDSGFAGAVTFQTTSTSQSFTGTVTAPTTYYYRVRAGSAGCGWSSWSAPASTVVRPETQLDLSIYKIEVSQAAQTVQWDVDHPVAEDAQNPMFTDRDTLVRIFVKSDLPPSGQVAVSGEVSILGIAWQCERSGKIDPRVYEPSLLKFASDRNDYTVVCHLPDYLPGLPGNYVLAATIYPEGALAETSTSNNSSSLTVAWEDPTGPDFSVRLLPTNFNFDSFDWSAVTVSMWADMCSSIEYAIPGRRVACRWNTTPIRLWSVPSSWPYAAAWRWFAVERAKIATAFSDDLLVAVTSTSAYFSPELPVINGFADVPCNGGDPYSCPDQTSCAGVETGNTVWVRYQPGDMAQSHSDLVHEVLHTQGLLHSKGVSLPDPCRPDSPMVNPETDDSLLITRENLGLTNIMSWGDGTKGLSQSNYEHLLDVASASSFAKTLAPEDAWLVAGALVDGHWQIAGVDRVVTDVSHAGGTFSLVGLGEAGEVLQQAGFELVRTSEQPEGSGFFLAAVPFDDRVRSFRVHGPGAEPAQVVRSAHAPAIRVTSPAAGATLHGAVALEWNASDADGDPLTFDVAYSVDDGSSWNPLAVGLTGSSFQVATEDLAGSGVGILRVRASDGFNVAEAEVSGLSVPDRAPRVEITDPPGGAVLEPQRVRVRALYRDPDAPQETPSSVAWYLDGVRLASAELGLHLEEVTLGDHLLRVVARSRDGETLSDETRFSILDRVGGPLTSLLDHTYVIPAAAHGSGLQNTRWLSDAVVSNVGQQPAAAHLYWLPGGSAAQTPHGVATSLAPARTLPLPDIVSSVFGVTSGAGAVLVTAEQPLVVTSTTYNDAPSGTFGQGIPGLPLGDAFATGEVARLIALSRNVQYRTNLGLVNLTGSDVVVDTTLYRSDGAVLGSNPVPLRPWEFRQETDIIGRFTEEPVDDAYALVSTSAPGSSFMAYASVVDNRSGDPELSLPTRVASAGESLVVAAAAHAPGIGGTSWRTQLEVHNPGSETAFYLIALLERDRENLSPRTVSFSLNPQMSARFGDVLHDVFGFTGAGALRITPLAGSLTVASRTFNDAVTGTYGQSIPGLMESEAVTYGGVRRLQQLRASISSTTGYRTNIGFTSASAGMQQVYLQLFTGSGQLVGSGTFSLAGYEHKQLTDVFRLLGAGEVTDGYALVQTLTPGARFFAYASVVDNRSGDPIFIAAQ